MSEQSGAIVAVEVRRLGGAVDATRGGRDVAYALPAGETVVWVTSQWNIGGVPVVDIGGVEYEVSDSSPNMSVDETTEYVTLTLASGLESATLDGTKVAVPGAESMYALVSLGAEQ